MRRQRGIALITAILLVALATILAATIGYENAMSARRGTATFAFDQSLEVGKAAEAIAAFALRFSRQQSPTVTYKGQPWSTPYGPLDLVPGVTLEAWLDDTQGRFNLNNLVNADGTTNPDAVAVFENLLTILGLEPTWAPLMADWIDSDTLPNNPNGAEDSVYLSQTPPYRAANMLITTPSEILALPGFGRDRYLKLEPYITALPRSVPINLCDASMAVLNALGPPGTINVSDAAAMAQSRAEGCWPTLQEFNAFFSTDSAAQQKADAMVATQSSYFTLTSIVSIGTTQFALYSLLFQDGSLRVRSIQRSFTMD
ncbi:MAG TPA: type II secretion system minor pseudopilin GspK [Steroidobacteraceae bacterium]|nr:type II secretion system minor pseudopilin GspK [Steroidobacteraceae bacterium]